MRAIPFTRVSGILPVAHCLERAGAPVERIARRAGVPSQLFDRPDAPIPMVPACRFYAVAARTLGCENLGSRLGQSIDAFDLGVYGALLGRSQTLYEGLVTATTFVSSYASANREWLEEEEERIWLCQGLCEGIGSGKRQAQAFVLQLTLQSLRRILGSDWEPLALRLPDHGDDWVRGLELGSSIEIDECQDHVAISIPRSLLSHPMPSAGRDAYFDPRSTLLSTSAPDEFVDALCLYLRDLLGEGVTDLDTLADALGTSPRSVQRRLASQGLTFSRLLERCRLKLAQEMLADPSARVIDVAYETGYSDPGNFARAFRRWSGVTPREYRLHAARSQ